MKMKTEILRLSQLSLNEANPRQIKDEKFVKLVNSMLVFPKMLEIRPVVADDAMMALGGNMRLRALVAIADMKPKDLKMRLAEIPDFCKKTAAEQELLRSHWLKWIKEPTATVIKASELSEQERREFIIKDNVGYGEWDYDSLANEWDKVDLDEWGVDVWQDEERGDENLPEELKGIDLTPDDLAKIKGDADAPMSRVIIAYPPEMKQELEAMLGVKIEKVVYDLRELTKHGKRE